MSSDSLGRVVVTGSECTGKTTLAAALADHYSALWVPEFSRQFVIEKGSPPDYRDVDAIARGQIELEDHAAAATRERGGALLILDTDLLSTVVYSRHYYGECPSWIEHELLIRAGDLYLLADIDVTWVPDGDLRDRGEQREEMQDLFRAALAELELPFTEVTGALEERLDSAIEVLERHSERTD